MHCYRFIFHKYVHIQDTCILYMYIIYIYVYIYMYIYICIWNLWMSSTFRSFNCNQTKVRVSRYCIYILQVIINSTGVFVIKTCISWYFTALKGLIIWCKTLADRSRLQWNSLITGGGYPKWRGTPKDHESDKTCTSPGVNIWRLMVWNPMAGWW